MGTVEVHIPKVAGNAPHPHAGQGPNGRKTALQARGDRLYARAAGGLRGPLFPFRAAILGLLVLQGLLALLLLLPVALGDEGLQLGLQLRVLGLVGSDLLLGLGLLALQAGHQEVVLLIEDLQLVLGGLNGLFRVGHLLLGGHQLLPVALGLFHVSVQLIQHGLVPLGHHLHQFLAGEKLRKALRIQQDLQRTQGAAAADVQGLQPLFKGVNGALVLLFGKGEPGLQLLDLTVHLLDGGPGLVDLLLVLVDLPGQLLLVGQSGLLILLQGVDLGLQVLILLLQFFLPVLHLVNRSGQGAHRKHQQHGQGKGYSPGQAPLLKRHTPSSPFSHRDFPTLPKAGYNPSLP